MLARSVSIATALVMLAVATAEAGSPCCCGNPCAAPASPMVVYQPYEMPQIYVVDQGPVYSGPGIYRAPTVVLPHPMPAYPYVGSEYHHLPAYSEPVLRSRAQASRRVLQRWQGR